MRYSKKKEIVVSAYTLDSVINMIILAGGTPVFVDLEKDSFNVCIKDLKKKITDNTAAIIITNLISIEEKIKEICLLSKEKNILLIEDCAVAFGTRNNRGMHAGTFSDVGVFSFQALKNIQSLIGGAIISSDGKFYDWLEKEIQKAPQQKQFFLLKRLIYIALVDFFTRTKVINFFFFQILKIAYKNDIDFIIRLVRADHKPSIIRNVPSYYFKKLSSAQASILNTQLDNIIVDQSVRLNTAKFYQENLKNVKNIKLLSYKNFSNLIHLEFPILVEEKEKLFDFLLKKNVDIRKHYYRNLSNLDCYKKFFSHNKNASITEGKILSLPCYPSYSQKNMREIIENIKLFYSY